jgi:hypothetical protein
MQGDSEGRWEETSAASSNAYFYLYGHGLKDWPAYAAKSEARLLMRVRWRQNPAGCGH